MPHSIITPSFTRTDERGIFRELLNEGNWQSILHGDSVAGAVMGNHYHLQTLVFFFLLSGAAHIITEHIHTGARDDFHLAAMQGVILRTEESHAITFTAASQYLLLKSQVYDPQAPDTYHHPLI
jgi:dTDP-4-dehydrorhamnose 3,5-epimerase-like enzyme